MGPAGKNGLFPLDFHAKRNKLKGFGRETALLWPAPKPETIRRAAARPYENNVGHPILARALGLYPATAKSPPLPTIPHKH
ncbi:MAG: hypothetical protein CTY16_08760 [Methylobacter sp.]|nr:MAG: hypothetical protein CTY16_08760 [Methylobacter sp.]